MVEQFRFNHPTTWHLRQRPIDYRHTAWSIEDEHGHEVASVRADSYQVGHRDISSCCVDARSGQEVFTGQFQPHHLVYFVKQNGQVLYSMHSDIPTAPRGWSCYRGEVPHGGGGHDLLVFEAPRRPCCVGHGAYVDAHGDDIAEVHLEHNAACHQVYCAEVEPGENSALVWAMIVAQATYKDHLARSKTKYNNEYGWADQ
mmetsp:Transcript_62996/g.117151  ORF Transcript_62996/g.117151 Transcript_62996/m.117151 type:complete len:200 (+) Transcript_62996:98-697(+)